MESKQQSKVCVHLLDQEKPYYFSPEQQKSTSDSFLQRALKLAWDHRSYIATCRCDPAQELKLYVRSNKGSGTFTLCRNPNTGPLQNHPAHTTLV